jgi:hypothetical protein
VLVIANIPTAKSAKKEMPEALRFQHFCAYVLFLRRRLYDCSFAVAHRQFPGQ